MEINKIIQGDCLEVLKNLPDECVNCIITSPPYWNLRDYGVEGQIGLEPTIEGYILKLCDIFDEIKRILKKTGTCFVNLGDTYSGSCNGAGDTTINKIQGNHHKEKYKGQKAGKTNLPNKSLCLIPQRFVIEMVNRGWICRNQLIWHKSNAMPSSVKDRFSVDYEPIFFFTKSKKYYFQQQIENTQAKIIESRMKKEIRTTASNNSKYKSFQKRTMTRNKRCVWTIPTKPFKESHFAVFPPELIQPMVKAGCPEKICVNCEIPQLIIKSGGNNAFNIKVRDVQKDRIKYSDRKASQEEIETYQEKRYNSPIKEKIIFSCKCNAGFKPGIVLDPFMGAGTTALVALHNNFDFLGIELKSEYIQIAEKRLKP